MIGSGPRLCFSPEAMAGAAALGGGGTVAAPGVVTQGYKTLAAIPAERRIRDVEPMISKVTVDTAPMTFLIEEFGRNKTVTQPMYEHLESDIRPLFVTVNGAVADSTATAIVVAAGTSARVTVDMVLLVPRTGEMMLVTNVVIATETLTVQRNFGQDISLAAAILDTEVINIVGSAAMENDTSKNSVTMEPGFGSNYIQNFKTPIGISRRAKQIELYGGDEWMRVTDDALEAHHRMREQSYIFNNGILAPDANGRSMTAGLVYLIQSNVTNFSAGLDEDGLEDWIIQWLRRNQGQKNLVVVAGETALKAIARFGRDYLRTSLDDTLLGLKVVEYQTMNGLVKFVPHGLLSPIGTSVSNANGGWSGYMFGLNLSKLGIATFTPLRKEENIQENDRDGRKDQWLSDEGLIMHVERCHAYAKCILPTDGSAT
jgi:hypothetical protein